MAPVASDDRRYDMGSVRELVPLRHHSKKGCQYAVHSDGHHAGRGSPGTDSQEHDGASEDLRQY